VGETVLAFRRGRKVGSGRLRMGGEWLPHQGKGLGGKRLRTAMKHVEEISTERKCRGETHRQLGKKRGLPLRAGRGKHPKLTPCSNGRRSDSKGGEMPGRGIGQAPKKGISVGQRGKTIQRKKEEDKCIRARA